VRPDACVRLLLYQGVWFPKEGGNDTIEKIADTRSDVAVQLLLFNQTMTSFKTAITLLRDMQQLIGKQRNAHPALTSLRANTPGMRLC
jgi:hypothetical protein